MNVIAALLAPTRWARRRPAPVATFTLVLCLAACGEGAPPPPAGPVPEFKLGTFERDGAVDFLGVVIHDTLVVDLAAADAAVPGAEPAVAPPTDMKDLIARYDQGVRARIGSVLAALDPTGTSRPAWVHDLAALRILPPIRYPTTMLNVAVNYREHDIEMAAVREGSPDQAVPTGGEALPGTTSAPGIWEREPDDPRWNPYVFMKAPAAIIAAGQAIRIPPGRTQIEWECELALVIGRTATRVPIEQAQDYIFGYTIENDVSDRGGRGDERYGSDWVLTKSHDTFAPMGPFITPREFIDDPMSLAIRYSLNGEVLQEGSTAQMIHDMHEIVAYASSILTLRPGDVLATGTPPGSGSARTPPIFFQPGDVSECTYEGVGTLVNPIEGSE